jgi:hypothetical protein
MVGACTQLPLERPAGQLFEWSSLGDGGAAGSGGVATLHSNESYQAARAEQECVGMYNSWFEWLVVTRLVPLVEVEISVRRMRYADSGGKWGGEEWV